MFDTLRAAARVFAPAGRRKRWLVVVAMAVALATAETGTAYLVFQVLGVAASGVDQSTVALPLGAEIGVTALVVVSALAFVLRGGLALATAFVHARVIQSASAELSSKIHARYIAAPYPFHLTRTSSESVRTILWSVDEATTNVVGPAIAIVTQGLVTATLLILLVAVAPGLTLVATLVLAVTMIVALRLVQPRLQYLGRRSEVTMGNLLASLRASFDSIRDIKAYGAESFFDSRFSGHRSRLANIRVRWTVLDQLPRMILELVVVIGLLTVIGLALERDSFESLVPTLGTFGYATLRLMPSATRLVASFNRLRFGQEAMRNVERDLALVDPAAPVAGAAADGSPLFVDSIELRDIWFSYPGTDIAALRGVELEIERGQMLAIAGGSGSGKSTLIDVLLGLLPPDRGTVVTDGGPPDMSAWRSRVGVVSQAVVLFDAPLRDNVAFGHGDPVDDERIVWALEVAQLGGWFGGLPDGLDSTVGETGKLVSGGERQRIAIARSLYRKPELLILDEATSALDGATEINLLAALRALPNMTSVVVSHRDAPLRVADRVVVMSEGAISRQGTYDQLFARHPDFRDLIGRSETQSTDS